MLKPLYLVLVEPIEEPTITENKSPSGLLYLLPSTNVNPWARAKVIRMPIRSGQNPYGIKVGDVVRYLKRNAQGWESSSENKMYTLVPESLLELIEE